MRFSTNQPKGQDKTTRDLNVGLTKRMRPDDQFNSFVTEVTIAAGETVGVPNFLKDTGGATVIPGEWAVIDSAGAPAGALVRGSEEWTANKLYLKNTSDNNGVFRLRFLQRSRRTPNESPLVAPTQGAQSIYAIITGDASQTVPATGTGYTKATLDAVVSENGDFSVSSDNITIPKSGIYLAALTLVDLVSTANNGVLVKIYNVTDSADVQIWSKAQLEANINVNCDALFVVNLDSSKSYAIYWVTETGTTASAQAAFRLILARLGAV